MNTNTERHIVSKRFGMKPDMNGRQVIFRLSTGEEVTQHKLSEAIGVHKHRLRES